MGLAEAIQDEEDRAKVELYASDIVEYSGTIKSIVVDLTGYSRSADSEYLTTVDIRSVIQEAVRLVERTMDISEGAIEMDVGADLYVNARTSELKQVFVNLLKNAVESVQEAEQEVGVKVSAGLDGRYLVAEVHDAGTGIPQDKLDVLFDPFFTTKPPGKGTGLGLNIVYGL